MMPRRLKVIPKLSRNPEIFGQAGKFLECYLNKQGNLIGKLQVFFPILEGGGGRGEREAALSLFSLDFVRFCLILFDFL